MAKNLLCIQPYNDQFMKTSLDAIKYALDKCDFKKLQVQFKYAEFQSFGTSLYYFYNDKQFKELTNPQRQKLQQMYNIQLNQHLTTLSILSRQSILHLNPLGKGVYVVNAGFNEYKHKKFYHIRQLLIKMCQFNSKSYVKSNLPNQPLNIYHELSFNNNNHLLKLVQEGQLRMDIYMNNQHIPQNLRGRYSYSNKQGWQKVVKNDLWQKIDYMLAQRTFRLAIAQQIQEQVSYQVIQEISNILKNSPKLIDVRLKRILRVKKGEISEYSLSEIYKINEKTGLVDLPERILQQKQELNSYIKKLFINFYSLQERQYIKYEIQNEFTHATLKRLKQYYKQNKIQQIKNQIETAIQQLYALFFADHTTKVKQMAWLNSMCREVPEARLQNQYGNYMREQIYSKMKSSNN